MLSEKVKEKSKYSSIDTFLSVNLTGFLFPKRGHVSKTIITGNFFNCKGFNHN